MNFDFDTKYFFKMAFGRRDVSQAFRNNCQLQQFMLTNVTPTGRVLGTGSYGSVEEVNFLFYDLCSNHCFTGVLEGIASGLIYLHDRPAPVIHRDLTANNILLTSSLVAKITDMGNSRIIDMRPGQLARTLLRLPGTLVYMPPEALNETHRYGPSLDIFSLGHLILYTATQVTMATIFLHKKYFKDLSGVSWRPATGTFPDPDNPERALARTEVERRGEYMEKY